MLRVRYTSKYFDFFHPFSTNLSTLESQVNNTDEIFIGHTFIDGNKFAMFQTTRGACIAFLPFWRSTLPPSAGLVYAKQQTWCWGYFIFSFFVQSWLQIQICNKFWAPEVFLKNILKLWKIILNLDDIALRNCKLDWKVHPYSVRKPVFCYSKKLK